MSRTLDPELRVILREWRDGSIHAEVPFAAFHDDEDPDAYAVCHLNCGTFRTACGLDWWGKTSASGYIETDRIDCPDCRKVLLPAD